MPGSTSATFSDPEIYQAAIRPAEVEIFVTAKGSFQAELNRTEFPRLWAQHGREKLPRVVHATVRAERPPIYFLAGADQPAMRYGGMELAFGEIMSPGTGSTHDHRTWAACHWGTLSLARDDLAAAGRALAGRDLLVSSTARRFRPAPALMALAVEPACDGGKACQDRTRDSFSPASEPRAGAGSDPDDDRLSD